MTTTQSNVRVNSVDITKHASTDDALCLENQVCFSLYSAANAMVRAYRPLLDKLDLTYPQYLVMLVLWEEQGINVKTLGDKLFLDSGTLTPLLKRLEAKGLVTRGRSEQDERVRVLALTPAGFTLKTLASEVPHLMRCKVGGEASELKALKAICDQTLKQLQASADAPTASDI
ncbi:MarR family winged helix-turn-helix transcriptional regulator [Shewanella glacialipiscicola]|uniref:MarR family transcriptional regulator n=1 Tax=Shewanella glacialipiscicola TaxID=614069 RepID=A0ABQ6IYK3_9GAMM|nr:MarR family transcriptional regulator [Shewanella glacialipiscicola]MCL1086965.1 MarR family transcriptional regulator [Shewanella glacialipiscicola]MCU7996064.1 MarR family transcriptional regulator [Shewanella glacialipiscicola]MCU8027317.1 MarR family transcriptional regulator [Shewanella glacialipiscicola]GIU15888.1 MarR family transcriptional regulator [Shewanella glacialipiscicola]GMA80951.1 MarR family transcriptional regulator [Shewanella glacialipiscicola]